jgi:membrane protease YdiL (CAAX protease family)
LFDDAFLDPAQSAMRALARRRPLLAFYLIALAIASAVIAFTVAVYARDPAAAGMLPKMVAEIEASGQHIHIGSIGAHVLQQPLLWGIFVFAAAPSLAALAVAALGGGGGLRLLLSRLKPIGPEGRLAPALLLYAGLLAVYAAGFWVYGFVAGPGVTIGDNLRLLGGSLLVGALLALFLDEGGTLEELGWRGFAWPLLQARWTPLAAALLLGVLHWAWHLPREVLSILGGIALPMWALYQGIFLLLCIVLAICAGFAVNRTGGSVWPAVFVHGGSNVWSKALGEHAAPSFGVLDLRTLLLILIALVIVILAGRNLGRLKPLQE